MALLAVHTILGLDLVEGPFRVRLDPDWIVANIGTILAVGQQSTRSPEMMQAVAFAATSFAPILARLEAEKREATRAAATAADGMS